MYNLRRAVRLRSAQFLLFLSITALYAFQISDGLAANAVQNENALPGTTSWQLSNPATNREIEGYASLTSVNQGKQISLFVNTSEPSYAIDIFRMGWYGGNG